MHAPSSATLPLPIPGSSATAAAAIDEAVTLSSSLAYLGGDWWKTRPNFGRLPLTALFACAELHMHVKKNKKRETKNRIDEVLERANANVEELVDTASPL